MPEKPILSLDLRREGIRSVIGATGFRPNYSRLRVPVLDHKGASATPAASPLCQACT